MRVEEALALDDGPAKTAALVAWIQSLSASDEEVPVLVGGAAVELYTGGAHATGDLDLVGSVGPRGRRALREAGFERHGRHWIHESAQVFVEFPGSSFGEGEVAVWVEVEGQRVRLVSAEDLIVERLGAWEHWRSSVDGANAFLLWKAQERTIDLRRLEARVEEEGRTKSWRSLRRFTARWRDAVPPMDERGPLRRRVAGGGGGTRLRRRRPRSFTEWRALRRWRKLPEWEMSIPGYLLRLARTEARLSQRALAEQLEVTQQAVSQAEQWSSNPTVDLMRRWAEACGRRLELRLDEAPEDRPPARESGK